MSDTEIQTPEADHLEGQHATKARRTRRKPAEQAAAPEKDVFDDAIEARQADEAQKKATAHLQGYWRDNEAGVRIEEDRKNRLTTILFREDPPEAATDRLADAGYKRDGDDRVYSKKIDGMRAYQHREEAEQLVLDVTNDVREAKGLPPRESYYISRS